jgi:hypothetical protein
LRLETIPLELKFGELATPIAFELAHYSVFSPLLCVGMSFCGFPSYSHVRAKDKTRRILFILASKTF